MDPKTVDSFEWPDQPAECECGWNGRGREAQTDIHGVDFYEFRCPECEEVLARAEVPSLEDARANWDRLSPEQRQRLEAAEKGRDEYLAAILTSERLGELPQLDGDEIVLQWDVPGDTAAEETVVITHGAREVWREPSYYENSGRFSELAGLLQRRYGHRLKDLVPTERSWFDLLGDHYLRHQDVERTREKLRRGERIDLD